MSKVRPKTIWLRRAEGTIEECERDGEHTVGTFIEADEVLHRWARTAPDDGTYDKCDFKITYEDGETYAGRFDLERKHECIEGVLAGHMRDFLTCIAGVRCPPHLTPEKYATFIGRDPERQVEAAKFLTTYQIGS